MCIAAAVFSICKNNGLKSGAEGLKGFATGIESVAVTDPRISIGVRLYCW